MKESIIGKKSFQFSLQIIKLCDSLRENKEWLFYNQLGKSGTSIGANVNEAKEAQSKADFISKLSISLKEARESEYWLNLLSESGKGKNYPSLKEILRSNDELIRILVSIIKTTKLRHLKNNFK